MKKRVLMELLFIASLWKYSMSYYCVLVTVYLLHAFLKVCWKLPATTPGPSNQPLPNFPASSFSPSHASQVLFSTAQSPYKCDPIYAPFSWFSLSSHHPAPAFTALTPSSYVTVSFSSPSWVPSDSGSLKNHFQLYFIPTSITPIRHLHVFPPWTTRFLIGLCVLFTTESPSPTQYQQYSECSIYRHWMKEVSGLTKICQSVHCILVMGSNQS